MLLHLSALYPPAAAVYYHPREGHDPGDEDRKHTARTEALRSEEQRWLSMAHALHRDASTVPIAGVKP